MSNESLLKKLCKGDYRSLAKILTIVENELPGHLDILKSLPLNKQTPLIGITGAPGSGKSSLVNAMLDILEKQEKKVGILAVDPSSPFNFGSLLGDRVRLSKHFTNNHFFIRSIASRGSLGGLSEKIIEMADVMRAAAFDYILLETVGVGQSEVEVAGLADITIVVLTPGTGDSVQAMKAGLMEIADIFVINKADLSGADALIMELHAMLHLREGDSLAIPLIKTTATTGVGVQELFDTIADVVKKGTDVEMKAHFLAHKAYKLIQKKRMEDVDVQDLREGVLKEMNKEGFNLYQYVESLS